MFHAAALADIVPSIQQPHASRLSGVSRFIYFASSSSYGTPDIYPTSEEAKIDPQYPYALTKRLGEEIVLHWCNVYDLPALSMRLFNVYGPRSRTSGTYGAMFGVFLAQKLSNKPFTIVGSGKQTRDFTYVSDVIEALLKASKSKLKNEILNVGSGRTVSILKIVKLLRGNKVYIKKRPGEPDCTFADITRIKSEIGWEPQVPIEEGVAELLNNIDYWLEAPVWTPDSIADATLDWFRYLDERN